MLYNSKRNKENIHIFTYIYFEYEQLAVNNELNSILNILFRSANKRWLIDFSVFIHFEFHSKYLCYIVFSFMGMAPKWTWQRIHIQNAKAIDWIYSFFHFIWSLFAIHIHFSFSLLFSQHRTLREKKKRHWMEYVLVVCRFVPPFYRLQKLEMYSCMIPQFRFIS